MGVMTFFKDGERANGGRKDFLGKYANLVLKNPEKYANLVLKSIKKYANLVLKSAKKYAIIV